MRHVLVATARDVDEVVVGPRRGDPDSASDPPGGTVRRLVGRTDRPVVVVPVPVA